MRFFFLFIPALMLAQLAMAQQSYIPRTRLLFEKGYELYLGADYFKTDKYIDTKGKRQSREEGESFQRTQVDVGGSYGLARNFQIGLGARLRQNNTTFNDQTNNEDQASVSGLQSIYTSVLLGFDPVERMSYALEGFYRYVPYSNSTIDNPLTFDYTRDLILGDVGSEYSLGGAVTYTSLSKNYLSARGGWRKPGDFLSTELYWQLEGALAWDSVAFLAGAEGVDSLDNGDEDRPLYNTGATALYHGLNREWINPYIGMNIAFSEKWRVELRGSSVVSGRSTDLGAGFGIQLIRRSESNPSKLLDAKFKAYDFEATVTKVSPKKGYIVIDKGLADDVQKGFKLDFYEFDYLGGNTLVARGVVIQTKVDSAIVKITQHYNLKREIKTGLVGRGQLK